MTAHVAEVKDCRCGHTNPARFPKGVGSSVQYGPITQALTVYLYQYQLMPYKRISQFFLDIFGLEVSPGSICTFQANTHDQLESTESAIVKALKKVPVAGADETGMRVTGSLWWLHVVCSDKWTYYHLDPGKGHSAIETRKDHGSENMAIFRQMSLNMLKQEKTEKTGIYNKRLVAASSDEYLELLLQGQI